MRLSSLILLWDVDVYVNGAGDGMAVYVNAKHHNLKVKDLSRAS